MLPLILTGTLFTSPPPGAIVNFVGLGAAPVEGTSEGGFGTDAPGWSSFSHNSFVSSPSATWAHPGNGTGWHDLISISTLASSSDEWSEQMYDWGYYNSANSYASAKSAINFGVRAEIPTADIPWGVSDVVVRFKRRVKLEWDVSSKLFGDPYQSESSATAIIGPLTKKSRRTTEGTHRDNNSQFGTLEDEDIYAVRQADGIVWTNVFLSGVNGYEVGPVKSFSRGSVTTYSAMMMLAEQSAYGAFTMQVGDVSFKWNPKRLKTTPSFPGLPSGGNGRDIVVEILNPTTLQVLQTRNGSIYASSHFMSPDVSNGTYTLRFRTKGSLPTIVTNVTLTDGQATNLNVALKLGDVNGDGAINATDAGIVTALSGLSIADPNWPDATSGGVSTIDCDLDRDGDVDSADLAIVQAND